MEKLNHKFLAKCWNQNRRESIKSLELHLLTSDQNFGEFPQYAQKTAIDLPSYVKQFPLIEQNSST